MKVFSCNSFKGYYPVGTAAVIIAPDKESAKVILEEALAKEGLPQNIPLDKIKELQTAQSEVLVLCNGNY